MSTPLAWIGGNVADIMTVLRADGDSTMLLVDGYHWPLQRCIGQIQDQPKARETSRMQEDHHCSRKHICTRPRTA